jgi:hypothetical protein
LGLAGTGQDRRERNGDQCGRKLETHEPIPDLEGSNHHLAVKPPSIMRIEPVKKLARLLAM